MMTLNLAIVSVDRRISDDQCDCIVYKINSTTATHPYVVSWQNPQIRVVAHLFPVAAILVLGWEEPEHESKACSSFGAQSSRRLQMQYGIIQFLFSIKNRELL